MVSVRKLVAVSVGWNWCAPFEADPFATRLLTTAFSNAPHDVAGRVTVPLTVALALPLTALPAHPETLAFPLPLVSDSVAETVSVKILVLGLGRL